MSYLARVAEETARNILIMTCDIIVFSLQKCIHFNIAVRKSNSYYIIIFSVTSVLSYSSRW